MHVDAHQEEAPGPAMDDATIEALLPGIHSREYVAGLTHGLYRYPARFSPKFARAVIEAFTDPGEVVLDPFMGGGTTLVEARATGRLGVGVDINALSSSLVRAKTTLLSDADIEDLRAWGSLIPQALNLRKSVVRDEAWIEAGYQRNINGKST